MEEIVQENMFEDKYKFKLDNFEGPLDLLLHLIKEAKMDIADVKLAEITEQYLEYMQGLDELDMDKASEFITVAATLIEIKSKSLLPKPEPEAPADEMDEEKLLLQRLKEYQLFKEASQDLHSIENLGKLYKAPDKNVGAPRFVLKDMVLDKLLDAFANILARAEEKVEKQEPKKIQKDRFTVAEKIISIKNLIREHKHLKFSELFEEEQTKSELINIFMAVLELLKLQIIKVVQPAIFAEIEIFENDRG